MIHISKTYIWCTLIIKSVINAFTMKFSNMHITPSFQNLYNLIQKYKEMKLDYSKNNIKSIPECDNYSQLPCYMEHDPKQNAYKNYKKNSFNNNNEWYKYFHNFFVKKHK